MRDPRAAIVRNASSAVAAVVLLAMSAGATAAADAEHGKALYRTCAACHTGQPDALGPSLKGVVGRKAAQVR